MRIQENIIGERLATGLGLFGIGLGLAQVIAPRKVERLIGVRDRTRPRNVVRAYGVREIATGVAILAQPGSARGVWSRVAGDVLDLAAIGTAYSKHDAKRGPLTIAAVSVLGLTALDILCSKQLQSNGDALKAPERFSKTIVIDRNPEDIYNFCRNLENVPKFVSVIESVEVHDGQRAHWKARLSRGRTMEWDTEIREDEPNRGFSWRGADRSKFRRSGSVQLEPAPGNRGTLVRLEMELAAPRMLARAAKAAGIPQAILSKSLHALKQILETGEVVQSESSVYGGLGMHPAQPPEQVPEEVFAH